MNRRRPRRPPVHLAGAALRRALWRSAFGLAGGLTVRGTPPLGPAVVLANHCSHADTAALLAALPAATRPLVTAAADYWFEVGWRRLLVGSVVAALPVSRGDAGGFAALRAAAAPHLRRGGVVVLYPEGTRSTDGTVGRFRSGGLRLAEQVGVPVVPVAVRGTGDLLPKHGRLTPGPVEVRFGPALDPAGCTPARLREEVVALVDAGPPRAAVSSRWEATQRWAGGPGLWAGAAAWGVAEATSWPVIAEMSLVLVGVAAPRRLLPAAACLAAGSAAGVGLTAALARRGVLLPAPLTTTRMHAAAAAHLAAGPAGVWHQLANGVPIKVYARQAGLARSPLPPFLAAAAAARTTRILGVGVLLTGAAQLLQPWLRRLYGGYLLAASAALALGLRRVYRSWR